MSNADDELPRCGYPTKSGSPCRNRVERAGKPCRVHMKAALLDRLLGRGDAEPEGNAAGGTAGSTS